MPGLDPNAGLDPGSVAEAAAPEAQGGGANPAHHGRKKPAWASLTSEQAALPGDPVDGVTDQSGDFTEDDRGRLRAALDDRLGANEPRADALTQEVPESIIDVWTEYVTESMKDAAKEDEGWPFWAKLLSFGARAVLMVVLFPEAEAEEAAATLAEMLLEKGTEFGLEQAADLAAESSAESRKDSKLEHESERLLKMSRVASSTITGTLAPIMRQMAQGIDYDRWLTAAPLSQLGLFRVPPLIPELKPAEIKARFAQAIAGVAHDQESVAVEPRGNLGFFDSKDHDRFTGEENTIVMKLNALGPGQVAVEGGPWFSGSPSLHKAMKGAPLRELANVPVQITFTASRGEALGPVVADMELLEKVFEAYPSQSPAKITRYTDGLVAVDAGGLAEHFHLYERLNPGQELASLMGDSAQGVDAPVSPGRTAADAAKELWQLMEPALVQGAELMLSLSLDQLQLL